MLRKVLIFAFLCLFMTMPVVAQVSEVDLTCDQTSIEGAEPGEIYEASCPADCSEGTIWGTGVYTNDSNICTAAAHAGVIDLADGGDFEIIIYGERESYPASEQNGIESAEWSTSWDMSFVFDTLPIEIDWDTTAQDFEAEPGLYGRIECPPDGEAGSIWGTDVYTDDSSICTAAVHAGWITFEEGGVFIMSIVDGQDEYVGGEANGVESMDYGEWGQSFAITPQLLEGDWDLTAQDLPGPTYTVFGIYCPPEGEAGPIWGTGVYTDDSSICTAAVHSGLITFEEGGAVYVTILDGQEEYESTEAYGVETSDYGEWERSFAVSF